MYSQSEFEKKTCKSGKGGWTKEDLLVMSKSLGIKLESKDKKSKALICEKISDYFKKITNDCKKNKTSTIMKEFKSKALKTKQGKVVTNPKQAIAIALSVAKRYCK